MNLLLHNKISKVTITKETRTRTNKHDRFYKPISKPVLLDALFSLYLCVSVAECKSVTRHTRVKRNFLFLKVYFINYKAICFEFLCFCVLILSRGSPS